MEQALTGFKRFAGEGIGKADRSANGRMDAAGADYSHCRSHTTDVAIIQVFGVAILHILLSYVHESAAFCELGARVKFIGVNTFRRMA